MGDPQNGWFVVETPLKMDDLGIAHDTPILWKAPYQNLGCNKSWKSSISNHTLWLSTLGWSRSGSMLLGWAGWNSHVLAAQDQLHSKWDAGKRPAGTWALEGMPRTKGATGSFQISNRGIGSVIDPNWIQLDPHSGSSYKVCCLVIPTEASILVWLTGDIESRTLIL